MSRLRSRIAHLSDSAQKSRLVPPRLVLDHAGHVAEYEAWLGSLSESDRARYLAAKAFPYRLVEPDSIT
jgi:hypothetical protein